MSLARAYGASTIVLALIVVAANQANCRAETSYVRTPHGREQVGTNLHDKTFGVHGPDTRLFGPQPTYTGWPRRRVSSPRVAKRETAAKTLQFDAFNLLVKLPNGPWEQSHPDATDTRARLILSRANPNIVISLAAERVGVKANDTNATALAAAQAKIRGLPGGEILLGEEQITVNGIEGINFKAFAIVDDRVPVHYSIWVATRNGYRYCVAAYGEQKDQAVIDEALLRFLGGIKQIEPHRAASTVEFRRQG